jgi:cytochrome c biogenesis protein CcdA
VTGRRWLLRWLVLLVVLLALVLIVGRVDVPLPGTSAQLALDFYAAYARPSWRLAPFLLALAAALVWSWRHRTPGGTP